MSNLQKLEKKSNLFENDQKIKFLGSMLPHYMALYVCYVTLRVCIENKHN